MASPIWQLTACTNILLHCSQLVESTRARLTKKKVELEQRSGPAGRLTGVKTGRKRLGGVEKARLKKRKALTEDAARCASPQACFQEEGNGKGDVTLSLIDHLTQS